MARAQAWGSPWRSARELAPGPCSWALGRFGLPHLSPAQRRHRHPAPRAAARAPHAAVNLTCRGGVPVVNVRGRAPGPAQTDTEPAEGGLFVTAQKHLESLKRRERTF